MNYTAKILMNSLYGRFGMNDNFNDIIVVDQKDYLKILNKYIKFIIDIKPLGNKFIFIVARDYTNTFLDNGTLTHNINIAIASAITAYARIHLSLKIEMILNYSIVIPIVLI